MYFLIIWVRKSEDRFDLIFQGYHFGVKVGYEDERAKHVLRLRYRGELLDVAAVCASKMERSHLFVDPKPTEATRCPLNAARNEGQEPVHFLK